MSFFSRIEGFIREKVEKERWTHKKILSYLKERYPNERGISTEVLRIHKTSRISSLELDYAVTAAASLVSF